VAAHVESIRGEGIVGLEWCLKRLRFRRALVLADVILKTAFYHGVGVRRILAE